MLNTFIEGLRISLTAHDKTLPVVSFRYLSVIRDCVATIILLFAASVILSAIAYKLDDEGMIIITIVNIPIYIFYFIEKMSQLKQYIMLYNDINKGS